MGESQNEEERKTRCWEEESPEMTRRTPGFLVAFYILAAAAPLYAQKDAQGHEYSSIAGFEVLNGRMWVAAATNTKLAYLSAILDEIQLRAVEKAAETIPRPGIDSVAVEDLIGNEWALGFALGDYQKTLDALYSEPENLLVPVVVAVKYYCTPKLKGDKTAAQMEEILIQLRKSARPSAAPAPKP